MSKIKLPYSQAKSLIDKIITALSPGCERIEAAGSYRRQKPEVGDLEIVCIPKMTLDLFGQPAGSLLDLVLANLVESGRLLPGDKNGPKYKNFYIPAVEGLKLDLFITTPECWGVIFTIRTGSAEFSHKLVTQQYQGGYLPNGWRVEGGRIWNNDEMWWISTPEERDVFKAIGLDWIEPAMRTAA